MGTAMHQLDRVVTGKGLERLRIAVDADRAHARWLALHQRTACGSHKSYLPQKS